MVNILYANEEYINETGRWLQDRLDEHASKDGKWNVFMRPYQIHYVDLRRSDCQILGDGYYKMKFKKRLSEALYNRELEPLLNTQESSVALTLLLNSFIMKERSTYKIIFFFVYQMYWFSAKIPSTDNYFLLLFPQNMTVLLVTIIIY